MTLHCGGVAREEAFKSSRAREKDEEEEEGKGRDLIIGRPFPSLRQMRRATPASVVSDLPASGLQATQMFPQSPEMS